MIALVLDWVVYIVSGVPALAGAKSLVIVLNVFAINLFPYPRAIAKAVASSCATVVAVLVTTAVVAIVPAVLGSVKVISAVDAGPIRVTLFDPIFEGSKNSRNPAEVEPFFS